MAHTWNSYSTAKCVLATIPSGYLYNELSCYYEIQNEEESTDGNGNVVLTITTSYYDCTTETYWDEVLVETYYGSDLCSSIPTGYTYNSKSDIWYYSEVLVGDEDTSTGITTTTSYDIVYDCNTNVISSDTVYYYSIDSCNSYQIPSAYSSYDSDTDSYYYVDDNSSYDYDAGVGYIDMTTYYYNCADKIYSAHSHYSEVTDHCYDANIPSGYTYNDDETIYE